MWSVFPVAGEEGDDSIGRNRPPCRRAPLPCSHNLQPGTQHDGQPLEHLLVGHHPHSGSWEGFAEGLGRVGSDRTQKEVKSTRAKCYRPIHGGKIPLERGRKYLWCFESPCCSCCWCYQGSGNQRSQVNSVKALVIHIFRDNFALCNDPLLGENLVRVKRKSKKDCSEGEVILETSCLGELTLNSGSIKVNPVKIFTP